MRKFSLKKTQRVMKIADLNSQNAITGAFSPNVR